MSIAALVEHGHRNGLIDQDRRTSLYKQLSRTNPRTGIRWRQQEPGWDARTPERPIAFADALVVAFGTEDPNAIAAALSTRIAPWRNEMLQLVLSGFDKEWSRALKEQRRAASYEAAIAATKLSGPSEVEHGVIDLIARRQARRRDATLA